MSKDTKPVKINAEVMWACLDRPNEMSGKYQVELTNLSAPAVDALADIGIEAKKNPQKPEKGFYITAKSKFPIVAYDTDGSVITSPVGNGSKARATLGTYPWTFKNKKGVSPSLMKLVITDLKVYVADKEQEEDEEEEAL